MKIFTQGARHFGGQIDRIDQGFLALGHELTQFIDQADLVYVNNAWYDQIITDKLAGRIHGKIIFNVLDLAPHLGSQFPLVRLSEQLVYADAITTISTFVQGDLQDRTDLGSTVIWNPIKPITRLDPRPLKYYRAMFVGRVNDPAKNCIVAAQALQILGVSASEVVTVGDQQPIYGGVYWGVAADFALNQLYNETDFVMFTSVSEGLGLPLIESMAAGAIPVVLRALPTREEFLPAAIFPEYLDVESTPQSIARFVARFLQDNGAMEEMKARLHAHYLVNWQEATSGIGVARRILEVYQSL